MNREIKFRAWDKERKEWHKLDMGNWESEPTPEEHILKVFDADGEVVFMQYTGLKDKNGKEIYEGDIIITNHELKRMEDKRRLPRYIVVAWVSTRYKIGFNIGNTNHQNSEVVGNVFESLELLEKDFGFRLHYDSTPIWPDNHDEQMKKIWERYKAETELDD